MNKCYHIFFSGAVHGVGFRYSAREIADKYKISGWVKNLPDGRVEVQAQGEPGDLDNFVQILKDNFKGYIKKTELQELPHNAEFQDFSIRF